MVPEIGSVPIVIQDVWTSHMLYHYNGIRWRGPGTVKQDLELVR